MRTAICHRLRRSLASAVILAAVVDATGPAVAEGAPAVGSSGNVAKDGIALRAPIHQPTQAAPARGGWAGRWRRTRNLRRKGRSPPARRPPARAAANSAKAASPSATPTTELGRRRARRADHRFLRYFR